MPRGLLAGLIEAAALEGATLRLLDHAEGLRVLRRSAAADPGLRTDPGYLAELAAWTGGLRQSYRPHEAQPGSGRLQGNGHAGRHLVMRDFAVRPDGRPLQAVFGSTSQLAVI